MMDMNRLVFNINFKIRANLKKLNLNQRQISVYSTAGPGQRFIKLETQRN